MFDKFCQDNHIGPISKGAFGRWITKNNYGYEDEQDLKVLWAGYLEDEAEDIQTLLRQLRGKNHD